MTINSPFVDQDLRVASFAREVMHVMNDDTIGPPLGISPDRVIFLAVMAYLHTVHVEDRISRRQLILIEGIFRRYGFDLSEWWGLSLA